MKAADDRLEAEQSGAESPRDVSLPSVVPTPKRRWWHRWIRTPGELHAMGVVGINMRNARFLLPNNSRRLYDLVDNKLRTKKLAEDRGLSVPETYGVISSPHDISKLDGLLAKRDSFVIKPARGSGGKGILVVASRDGDWFFKPSGSRLHLNEVRHHLANILAGLFSLGGRRDSALIEYRVTPAKVLTDISFQGAPDIRIVMLHGYPVMAMLRASTMESDGRSNLHQGAIGVGIDLHSGRTVRAIYHGHPIERHPDLKVPVLGVQMPHWERILEMAVICHEMTGLGYLGVDLMIDDEKGPLMIEVNARPGLAIQMANGVGLLRRLEPAAARAANHPYDTRDQKLAFSRATFRALNV